jgi:putative hydrolase of the HAD superfamily
MRRVRYRAVLKAVLFDWGDTLMRDAWNDEIARAGNAAGLAALAEREDLPDIEALAAWWQRPNPLDDLRREEEPDMLELHRSCFTELGCELSDEELGAYFAAAYRSWQEHITVGDDAHALLQSLRERGVRLAIVSNVAVPGRYVRALLEEQGLADRVDAVVLSCEVGKRKPHPAIFERALEELGVDAGHALFVGDRRYHDVGGASRLGMRTVQALWFVEDQDAEGPEPDHHAFAMLDVLAVADRLRGAD